MANGIHKVGCIDYGVRLLSLYFRMGLIFLDWDDRTCFWGGDTFAPKMKVKNVAGQEVSIQEFLQGAFLDMFDKVVEAVGDLDSVIGFEVSVR